MKRAKVSELKAHLSSYLAEVRRGDTLVVCERSTPIARLVPFEGNEEEFKVYESGRPIRELERVRPVRLNKKVELVKLLRETRGER